MTTAEKLYQLIPSLTDAQLSEVLDFAEFLHHKKSQNNHSKTPTTEIADAIETMAGLLRTDQSAPTDEEVALMLENRREAKYL
ncbi:DUF2281 domain-containing protein [[Limnothrix rosea] IAM M-220]|uniref:DUF2281 domain-containing protein n=1 Tax=[Limnothrix rosea] IAM M-220 TaxID=454133 RepID=UPI00096360E5|nr:DUF2281 domain-containing protein [[Limnothrix rosea] IAM M-220]OKH17577.1 hypothetical protein NIES208_08685 [[Limnothrix rosea] IAM M-220]